MTYDGKSFLSKAERTELGMAHYPTQSEYQGFRRETRDSVGATLLVLEDSTP